MGGRHETAGGSVQEGNEVVKQLWRQLFLEMDLAAAAPGVTVLGATNCPDRLDPALLAPGVPSLPPVLSGWTADPELSGFGGGGCWLFVLVFFWLVFDRKNLLLFRWLGRVSPE